MTAVPRLEETSREEGMPRPCAGELHVGCQGGVADEEARRLLLTIDPLASLAEQQEQLRRRLLEITPLKSPDLEAALQATVDDVLKTPHNEPPAGFQTIGEQFLILVTCRDEKEQVELLRRFTDEGWECKALVA